MEADVRDDLTSENSTVGIQQASSRLDTSLEAAGAEFLVLGNLLIEGIQAFKAYANFPGYDIVATNPEHNRSCRIQVKSRWATDFNRGFPIRNFDCDFVVLVALNRGYRYRRKPTSADMGKRVPQCYIFPTAIVRAAQRPTSKLGIVPLGNIADLDHYRDNWELVKAFLQVETAADA
jgi:hypothetical protein